MLKEGIFRLLNVITLLKPLTPLFLQRDFIISSTFDLVTRQGGEKSVQALSVAGRLAGALAGAGLRSAAASCGPAIMFLSGLASGAAAEKEEIC